MVTRLSEGKSEVIALAAAPAAVVGFCCEADLERVSLRLSFECACGLYLPDERLELCVRECCGCDCFERDRKVGKKLHDALRGARCSADGRPRRI